MPAITIDLDQEQIDRAQELADKLTAAYGTKVSRASIIRRAIMAFEPKELEQEDQPNDK
jgi:predicted transcriptional regulator